MAQVTIAAIGMVSSLGADAATSCAAARAGLSRPRVLPNYRIRSEVEGDVEPVIGHPAAFLTHGFEGVARLSRLAQASLDSLRATAPQFAWQERPHAFYLSVPDPRRNTIGIDPDPEEGEDAGEAGRPPIDGAAFAGGVLSHGAALARWPGEPEVRFASTCGHCGGISALETAVRDLDAGAVEAAVVLAVDSLLDEETLDWLQGAGRLKCDGAPAGLQPGEAGVAILLQASALDGTPRPATTIRSVATGAEPRSYASGRVSVGEGLCDVLARASRDVSLERAWIVSDHNGETFRATEWGSTLVRLRAVHPAFAQATFWHPAASFGDTGAASALVSVAVAARAFARAYNAAELALVGSASDTGERGALALACAA
jgi:3-oxoacyl-[acyl-carrier-protein] synthase-1